MNEQMLVVLTPDQVLVDTLTESLDVRCVYEEFAAILAEQVQRICGDGSVPASQAQRICELPLLTSISVRSCHLFIATTHLSPRRRQLCKIAQRTLANSIVRPAPDVNDESLFANNLA